MEIGLKHFLVFAAILFTFGTCGILINRKSIINVLLSIEILFLAININLVAFSAFMHDITGQIFVMFVLTVAAAKSGVGLAILVIYYKSCDSIDIERPSLMKE